MERQWTSVGLPLDLIAEITEIGRRKDRTKAAVIKRAIAVYRQQSEYQDSGVALK